MVEPTQILPPETAPDDPRCGRFIARAFEGTPAFVLIGFPSDEGVRRNGGRPGAAGAPDRIRQALYTFTPDPLSFDAHSRLLTQTLDVGNIRCTGDVEADQAMLGREVARWAAKGARVIVIGGGHETTYGHFLGYASREQHVHILNIDAHADVRPLKAGQAHSGSPFRQALEYPGAYCSEYTVFGLAPWSTARSHLAYLDAAGASYYWDHQSTPEVFDSFFETLDQSALLSLDIDVIEAMQAPGVSAPASRGLPLDTVLHACFLAGQSQQVRSFDVVEVNPAMDIDGRTARSAALCVWHMLRGAALIEGA